MAQQNIIGSLFGITPESYLQNRQAQELAQARQYGQGIGTLANVGTYAAQQGQMLGKGIGGLLGVEDPQLKMVRDVQEMRSQFDITTPEGMQGFAQAIAPKYPQLAVQAVDKANQMMKTGSEALTARQKIDQEKLLRGELAKLPEDASDEDMLKVFRKFGTPDQQTRAIQASLDKKAGIEARRFVLEEKKAEKDAKLNQQQEMAIGAVDRVINEVKEAKPLVGKFTAGFGGSALSSIPGTDARDLQAKLTTIKANLGFDRLQQMRDASPTGGALGQVAVQELVALQSTVASLDQAQSPKQLRDALDKIESHYTKWRATVRKAGGQEQATPDAAGTQDTEQQAPIYAINPTTKERRVSTDGGNTWKPVGGR